MAMNRALNTLLLLTSLLAAAFSVSSDAARGLDAELKSSKGHKSDGGGGGGIPGFPGGDPTGGFMGPPIGGFNMPGLGGGWGSGYGGPGGGYARGGVVAPTVVCSEKGPCYKKKVTCPKRCFSSFSRSGHGYGAGGGGGGCTIDCKTKCTASC